MYGKTVSDSVNNHLSLLNDKQKTVLYELAVLKKNSVNADEFWLKHKNEFPKFDNKVRDELASQVFVNSQVVYSPPKNSAIQFWMQTQLLTNWMFYLSAFIAICALLALFKRYWSLLIQFLINRLAPLFKFLFSPVLLTYELLLIGAACVFYGCLIEDFVLRTVIVHLGLFLLWSQSTAIFTKEYWVKKYVYEIENNFWGSDPWETIKTISFPAVVVTLALLFVLYKVPQDIFYNYEIVISSIAAIYALPFWRSLEKYIYPVLFPFSAADDNRDRSINSLGACMVIAIIVSVTLAFQLNPVFNNIISALVSLLMLSFLIISSKINHKRSFRNYCYLQFITIVFLLAALAYGYFVRLNEIIWFSIIGTSLFILIKYMEIFSFFSDWKRGRAWAWKLMGLAGLLWLMGKGILYVSEMLFITTSTL
ncbi:hypothetical protein KHA98_02280 [Flavobacterium branchiicola]|nr:hypothetical protein [Flavobacterium branchiicola]